MRSNEVKRHIEQCNQKAQAAMERVRKYMASTPPNMELATVHATILVRNRHVSTGWRKMLTELTRQIQKVKLSTVVPSADDALVDANILNALAMQATAPLSDEQLQSLVDEYLQKLLLCPPLPSPAATFDAELANRLKNLRQL